MPGTNVSWPIPLWRQRIFYPGQFGVPGTDSEEGIRTDSHGTVFYVDPNAAGVSDSRDGTDPRHPLRTVAAALTHCAAYHGDVIAVMANNSWQYGSAADGRTTAIVEEVTITVPGVRLVGVSSGGQGVYWYPASNGGTCITVHALDVLIEGFFFSEGPTYTGCTAISAEWDGVTMFADNLTVRHCTFDDTVDVAIDLDYCWYNEIANCLFWGCAQQGIYQDPTGSGIAYTIIHDNVFHDCGLSYVTGGAIVISEADYCHIYRNSIFNAHGEAGAAAADEGIDTSSGSYNQIFDNWFSCLLPVPGNGDWDDLNSGSGTDAWINNHCLNGEAVTTPT